MLGVPRSSVCAPFICRRPWIRHAKSVDIAHRIKLSRGCRQYDIEVQNKITSKTLEITFCPWRHLKSKGFRHIATPLFDDQRFVTEVGLVPEELSDSRAEAFLLRLGDLINGSTQDVKDFFLDTTPVALSNRTQLVTYSVFHVTDDQWFHRNFFRYHKNIETQ